MKYIYLDQNKWIELAKGINQTDTKYIELHQTMVNNVKKGYWAFPLSSIHITKRKDEISRKQIVDLMYSISNGYTICDFSTADSIEFEYWVKSMNSDFSQLKTTMIKRDWGNIIGISIEEVFLKLGEQNGLLPHQLEILKKEIKNYYSDRDVFDYICQIIKGDKIYEDEEFFYDCYKKEKQSFIIWKQDIEKNDEYKKKHLYPAYLLKVFFELYKTRIESLSPEMKNNFAEMVEKNKKNKTMAISSLEAMPGFNIYNRLMFELNNNPDKKVHKHDFNDLAYLRVAVPYCDIVIGENYWCDRVCHYGLERKYNTIVTTKLFHLLDN